MTRVTLAAFLMMGCLQAQTAHVSPQGPDGKPLEQPLPSGVVLKDAKGRDNGVRFIDLNGDGFDDLVFANSERYGVYLYNPVEKKNVDWRLGWTFVMREGKMWDANHIPPFVDADGAPTGVKFESGGLLADGKVIPFSELLRQPGPPPKSPEDSLKAIHLKKGFKIELVANEPLVQDPIFIDWDAKGRMWVVEMGDYPFHDEARNAAGDLLFETPPGQKLHLCNGRVKILEDTDGDGIYDKATVFLDNLQYPTGLALWKDGVFIASVPDVFFIEEKDGKPGKRTTIMSGFKLGNPQHLVNGFCWGLDGWFYGGNGDSGGKVVETKSGKEFDLSGRDYRFNPITGEFQLQAGKTQYGRWRDDFGNWFGCNNSSMGWHYFMDERYLARNPKLAVPSLRRVLNKEPDTLHIYPVSSGVRRLNWADAVNTLTSGCNAMPYRDTLFGAEYARSFFICEPANNLVHREVLEPDGISFRSHRAADEKDYEFLASEDNWSRFTQARTGPDGCLYVVDMYRQVIEHPEWIPKLMLQHMDVRAGEDKGRIYRVTKEGVGRRNVPPLDKKNPAKLVVALDAPNGWVRDTAQRLLIEAATESATEASAGVSPTATAAQTHASHIIQTMRASHQMGKLDERELIAALHHPDAQVRTHAVRIGEDRLARDAITNELINLANDPDLRVRVQVALTLGETADPRVPDALRALAKRDADNPDMLIALLTAAPKHEVALADDAKAWQVKLKELQKTSGSKPPVQIITNNNPDRDKIVKQYAVVTGLKGNAEHGHTLYKTVCIACHKLKNEGNEIGPDLGTISGKPTDQIIEAIMDPSRAVEMRYLAHTVTLKDGRVIIGMIAEETPNSVTLKTAVGTEVLLRADIKSRKASTKSIMPDGLESLLKPQDVADVIEWIRTK